MAADDAPMFTAISSSARQLLMLLRCLPSTKKCLVRITADGIRFTTSTDSTTDSFVFLEKALFSTYNFIPLPPPSSQDHSLSPTTFEINLPSLLETLNIFSLSDTGPTKRGGGYDDFTLHRLNRHSGLPTLFSTHLTTGICTLTYAGEGHPLSIHMTESNVSTTSDLTTYQADDNSTEEIPFARDALALKTIMRSSYLLEAISELSSLGPETMNITASPSPRLTTRVNAANLSLSAVGPLGEAQVDFSTHTSSETPVLETFHCPAKTSASFRFAAVKGAQRAMAAASKVSVRLDEGGVLSLQFLVEVDGQGGQGVVFVDFRVVPVVEGDDGGGGEREVHGESTDSE